VYSREPQGNATCYDSLSIATAGVYRMTWWSLTKVSYSNNNDWD
jgi:hypothetical protein